MLHFFNPATEFYQSRHPFLPEKQTMELYIVSLTSTITNKEKTSGRLQQSLICERIVLQKLKT